jgi:hypothetical protein
MSKHNDGGPAFPSHGSMGEVAHEGMTLRDYMAIHASEDDVSDAAEEAFGMDGRAYPRNWRQVARYFHADAMLAARGGNDGR